jgi:exodeoxyribonuclease-3
MKITTWNVNGIRAVIGKGFHAWVGSNAPDVLCLQEIKARPDQVENADDFIEGYYSYWNPAQRPGYSGVATFSRRKPDEVIVGLGDERFDAEGRVIRCDFGDLTLFNVYFPNGQRGQERVDYKLEFYARLLQICDELMASGRQLIVTGDFNTAHCEIDLANPKENAKTSGFLPEEREWIDRYLQHGFVDAYRVLYPQRVQYTWWTYRFGARGRNIGWRLDYYLVSAGLMERVEDVVIFDDVTGSDHCPVSLILNE